MTAPAAAVLRFASALRCRRRSAGCAPGVTKADLRSQRIAAYGGVILAAVEAEVDITLAELADLLRREHGVWFAPSTIWRFLDRHDMSFKKNRARQRAAAAGRCRTAAGLVRRAA